jgi:hypothetical protein
MSIGGRMRKRETQRGRKTDLALKAPVRQNLPNRVRASGPWRSYPGKPDNSMKRSSNT